MESATVVVSSSTVHQHSDFRANSSFVTTVGPPSSSHRVLEAPIAFDQIGGIACHSSDVALCTKVPDWSSKGGILRPQEAEFNV